MSRPRWLLSVGVGVSSSFGGAASQAGIGSQSAPGTPLPVVSLSLVVPEVELVVVVAVSVVGPVLVVAGPLSLPLSLPLLGSVSAVSVPAPVVIVELWVDVGSPVGAVVSVALARPESSPQPGRARSVSVRRLREEPWRGGVMIV